MTLASMGSGDGSLWSGRLTLQQGGRFGSCGYKMRMVDAQGRHAGKLYFYACKHCGKGWIGEIAVYSSVEGRTGLGRRLLAMARAAHPGLTWTTSQQRPTSLPFWHRMAGENGGQYQVGPKPTCDHSGASPGPLDGAVVRFGG